LCAESWSQSKNCYSVRMGELEMLSTYIPFDLFESSNAIKAFIFLFLLINARYWFFASIAWLLLYRPSQFGSWRLPVIKTSATRSQQIMEMGYSFLCSFIFAGAGLLLGGLWQAGITQIYLPFSKWDLVYIPVSAFFLIFFHDAYFYWTHRWLHLPKVFKRFHSVHHASRETSPWSSFSFHPLESLINALALPLIVLFLPVHPLLILFHLTLMTLTAVTNHVGVEILPRFLVSFGFHRYWISGYHHGQHHVLYKYNYGLFFCWWDRWMGTESPNFDCAIHKHIKKLPCQV